jgi:hypothetical protein
MRAPGWRKAATSRWPSCCSTRSTWTAISSNTTPERAGGFEPLRFLPKGKTAVLGLVTTKSAKLESKDDLKRRIDQAARFVPLEQLALSPQCGFESGIGGNTMTIEQEGRETSARRRDGDESGVAPKFLGGA